MNTQKIGILALLGILIVSFLLIRAYIYCADNVTEPETQSHIIKNITTQQAYVLIQNNKNNPNFVILDVRTLQEFTGGHIENAINLDYYSETFRDALNKLDKNKIYLIYCRTGRRSGISLRIMKELGFREVYNMLGGIIKWETRGFPTTK